MTKLYQHIFILFSSVFLSLCAYSSSSDRCDGLEGTWTGTGDVRFFIISCGYDATVNIGEGNPADVNLSVIKSSGSFLCPRQVSYNMSANCDDGFVQIKNEKVDVNGEISEDKKSMSFTGIIRILVSSFNISLKLTR